MLCNKRVGGTEDAWLLKDDEYIAAMLRKQNLISEAGLSKEGAYSLWELDVLGQCPGRDLLHREKRLAVPDLIRSGYGSLLALLL
ncbi:hypothetical protein IMSAGC012_00766 [Lachnospiraceae bacterium]|nr:hypothetical protein IMSAGC012_00766 [Lachnospiraceae bacterium]